MTEPAGRDEMLFTTAVALPSSERELYLDRACSDNDTRARVQALVDASARVAALVINDSIQPPLDAGPAQVENYRILEDLGEGGWGSVYRAEQVSPLRREVALKIIKLGMDTKAVIIRFEAERQALAMMDHPNIAKVFDAGVTNAGRSYFAMELVRGVKITQYCDSVRASVAERLALFVQVCQAIQHAHRKGIIHRDVKPSNVMVTLCDGEAVVKVIDFGVAKAIQSGPPENTMLTVFGAFVGTPAYVSPEQMEYGARIDARSDIYSLGVLLHEMLSGCTPFTPGDLSASALHALRSRVRGEEPRLPSKVLSSLPAETTQKTADCCRTTRSKLISQLQGDLDWIVMRCLEKDPAKRYQSARDLSADLQRYLRDEPVVARPRRLIYSFNKFAKRHRTVFATGAAIISVLLVTIALTSWLAVRAARASRLAESVATFLQNDLLVQDRPGLQLETILDRAAEKVGERFAAEPLVEASIRSILATAYDSVGATESTQAQFERALAIYEQEYGTKDSRTLTVMAKVAAAAAKQRHFDEAERVGLRALHHFRKVLGDNSIATLTLTTAMAQVLFDEGKYDESRELIESYRQAQETILGPDHPANLESLLLLASIDEHRGRYSEAIALARRVFDARVRILGRWHPSTRAAAMILGSIYRGSGQCVLAGPEVQKAEPAEVAPLEKVVVTAPRIRSVVVSAPRIRSVDAYDFAPEYWQCTTPTKPDTLG